MSFELARRLNDEIVKHYKEHGFDPQSIDLIEAIKTLGYLTRGYTRAYATLLVPMVDHAFAAIVAEIEARNAEGAFLTSEPAELRQTQPSVVDAENEALVETYGLAVEKMVEAGLGESKNESAARTALLHALSRQRRS